MEEGVEDLMEEEDQYQEEDPFLEEDRMEEEVQYQEGDPFLEEDRFLEGDQFQGEDRTVEEDPMEEVDPMGEGLMVRLSQLYQENCDAFLSKYDLKILCTRFRIRKRLRRWEISS